MTKRWIQVNWEAIEAVSSFVATVATLITLIYLGIQLRASNKLSRSDSLKAVLNGYTDRVLNPLLADAILGDVVDRGMASWEALTQSERGRFSNHQAREVLQVQSIMQLYDSKLIDAVDFETWVSHVASTLITPGGKVAWGYNRNSVTPTVASLLEKYIKEHPDMPPYTEVHLYRYSAE
jgi:hypothetical protein